MKVLVSDPFPKEEFTNKDFNWCEPEELLMISYIKPTEHQPRYTLVGTKTLKHTTRWKMKEVKGMDEDLFLDLIVDSHKKSGLYEDEGLASDDFMSVAFMSTDEVFNETMKFIQAYNTQHPSTK